MISKKHFLAILSFSVISIWLSYSWVAPGKYVGGGDVGIPTYLPQKTLSIVSQAWWEAQSTGTTSPMTYTPVPFYSFLSFLDKVGITPDITQKLFFLIILIGGSVSVYFLCLEFRLERHTGLLAGLFYMANLTVLSVWHRGIHNAMLMLVLAPVTLFFLARGLNKKQFRSILWINLASFVFSYVFGSPAFVFSLWLLWGVLLGVAIFTQNKKFVITYAIVLYGSWVLTNSWWLVNFLVSSKIVFGQLSVMDLRHSSSDVVSALRPQTDPAFILRGLSRFQLYEVEDWGKSYSNPFFIVLSWLPILLVYAMSLFGTVRKSRWGKFSLILLAVVWLLSKGSNPPFGWLNLAMFKYLPVLTPLRNAYEKVGIILAIPMAILFASAIYSIPKKSIRIVLSCLCLVVLVWPLWLGKMFVGSATKAVISIPEYYSQASAWLESRIGTSRILHLPLAPGESVDYTWGYSGIEPSQLLFPGSSIAYLPGVPTIDLLHKELIRVIHKQDQADLKKMLSTMDVGWIVIHKETDWRSRRMEDLEQLRPWVESLPFLNHVIDFGPLEVWKVDPTLQTGRVYVGTSPVSISQQDSKSLPSVWKYLSDPRSIYFSAPTGVDLADVLSHTKEQLIFPFHLIAYWDKPFISVENAIKELVYVRVLPGAKSYPLIRLKEMLLGLLPFSENPIMSCLNMAGKRLSESATLNLKGQREAGVRNLSSYVQQLGECRRIGLLADIFSQDDLFIQSVSSSLYRQVVVLNTRFDGAVVAEVSAAKDRLHELMAFLGIESKYRSLSATSSGSIAYWYDLPLSSASIKVDNFSSDLITTFPELRQINAEQITAAFGQGSSTELKTRTLNFDPGLNELHVVMPVFKTQQLISDDKPIILDSSGNNHIEFPLTFVPTVHYFEISFDYYVDKGSPFVFSVEQDTDLVNKKSEVVPAIRDQLVLSDYEFGWRNHTYRYTPSINANKAKIKVTAFPWNNCESFRSKLICEDKNIRKEFDRQSIVRIKNLQVREIQSITPYIDIAQTAVPLGEADVDFQRVDSTMYDLNVNNQVLPYILVLSETFHPSWQLTDNNGKIIDASHFSVNGFANAWYITKELPEGVRIEFSLRNLRAKGIIISLFGIMGVVSVCYILDRIKRKND